MFFSMLVYFKKYSNFRWSFCDPKFEIQDADHNPVLMIEGPTCTMNPCGGDVEFKVCFQ